MTAAIVSRSKLLWGLAAVCGLVAAQSCASVDSLVVAQPGVAFSLPIGKTAALRGSATRLTFNQVRADSRCPTNVVCVWEGDATIEVGVTRNGGGAESRVMSIRPPNNEVRIGNLQIRFVGLAPYPATPEDVPRLYVAEFVVNEA